jgi:acyl-[acyl-carrier-protein]-phospholipid O-acyltransferase / long-chain-fatty-acid--[acyl-carrier-protein] ligase
MDTAVHLLKTRRFLPIFVTVFLGAFNDNLFKMAMVTVITYELAAKMGLDAGVLNPLAGGLFILPFVLFSAFAGQLADKYEKSRQIRIIKFVEILIMILGAISLYYSNINLMFFTLFMLGAQSTFFGPIKYSILPNHLKDNELMGGNALIETATFISILLGNVVGGLLVLADNGILWTSALTLACAIIGWRSGSMVPITERADPDLKINYNIVSESWRLLKRSKSNKQVFKSVLAISWFWFFGSLFLIQFPTFAKDVIGANESVLTLFIATFSLGTGAGSMLCSHALKGEISLKFVPLAALLMTAFCFDLYFASGQAVASKSDQLITLSTYLQSATNWRVLIDFLGVAVAGGFYIVPLYTNIQSKANKAELSRMIASNNIINSFFIVGSAVLAAGLIMAGFSVPEVFLVGGILNCVVALLLIKSTKEDVVKKFALSFFGQK